MEGIAAVFGIADIALRAGSRLRYVQTFEIEMKSRCR